MERIGDRVSLNIESDGLHSKEEGVCVGSGRGWGLWGGWGGGVFCWGLGSVGSEGLLSGSGYTVSSMLSVSWVIVAIAFVYELE